MINNFRHNQKSTKPGFTIAELALACAFLGMLLITIAILVTHIISIYQKGLSLKAVNTVGEDLIDDFSRSIAASPSTNLRDLCFNLSSTSNQTACTNDSGYGLMSQQRTTNVRIVSNQTDLDNVPASGAFCTGRYSYLYNSGYILSDEIGLNGAVYTKPNGTSLNDQRATLTVGTGTTAKVYSDFRLLRIEDTEREICTSGITSGSYTAIGKDYRLSSPDAEITEMLERSEDNLALYDFTAFRPAYHDTTKHAFYSATFILATIRGGVNILASGDFCTENPDDLDTDFAYCAMNKFNFAVRATGENLE